MAGWIATFAGSLIDYNIRFANQGKKLLNDNIIYTTAEIIIQGSNDFIFRREKDGSTTWDELQVKKRED